MKVFDKRQITTTTNNTVSYFNPQEVEDFLRDMIKADHPTWIDEDGNCDECDDYYDGLEDAVVFEKEID